MNHSIAQHVRQRNLIIQDIYEHLLSQKELVTEVVELSDLFRYKNDQLEEWVNERGGPSNLSHGEKVVMMLKFKEIDAISDDFDELSWKAMKLDAKIRRLHEKKTEIKDQIENDIKTDIKNDTRNDRRQHNTPRQPTICLLVLLLFLLLAFSGLLESVNLRYSGSS